VRTRATAAGGAANIGTWLASKAEWLLPRLLPDTLEDLPGKWEAAILKTEDSRSKLRVVGGD
jgi:hypothetical protein